MPALLRIAATVAAASALTVAAPIAANADPYPPATTADWSGAACAGGTFTHTLPAGTFDASRTLSESITGTGQSVPAAGVFLAAQTTYSLTSTASGAATVALTFPAAATGSYNVSITEQGGTKTSSGAITVDTSGAAACTASTSGPTDPAVDPSSTDPVAAAATGSLATTGTHISEGIVWSAAGVVIIGAVLTIVAGRRRRRPRQD